MIKRISLLALAACLLMTAVDAKPVKAIIRSVKGYVEYAEPGSDTYKALTRPRKVDAGTKIRTGEDGSVIVTVVPGAAMKIAPNTEITLSEMAFKKEGEKVTERKAKVKLDKGTVSSLIDPKTPDITDFKIETPQGTAAARGTFYGVTYEDGQTFVSVAKGKIGLLQEDEEEAANSEDEATE